MRIASKVDTNQPAIVRALRRAGASVQILSMVGRGCPDVAVGFRGQTYLLEIKDGSLPPSKRALTPDEARWHEEWKGQVGVVESIEDALRVIGVSGG